MIYQSHSHYLVRRRKLLTSSEIIVPYKSDTWVLSILTRKIPRIKFEAKKINIQNILTNFICVQLNDQYIIIFIKNKVISYGLSNIRTCYYSYTK